MVAHLLPVWHFNPFSTLAALLCASGCWHQRLSKASYLEGGSRPGGHQSFDFFLGRSPQTLCPSFKVICPARCFLLRIPSEFWNPLPLLNPSALILTPLPVGISHRELQHLCSPEPGSTSAVACSASFSHLVWERHLFLAEMPLAS